MYRSIDDFLKDWKVEEELTLKIFKVITDDVKDKQIHEYVRTLDRLAWHLTQTITEMGKAAGILPEDLTENSAIPATMAEICEVYTSNSDLLCNALQLKWMDSALADLVPMYGEEWMKGKILHVILTHQTHHRGQMTVIMRLLGLPVPGLYGPSREEWIEMGLPAME
ncbi:DinB family protein [Pedobacter sp. AW31-3R]|uniref:DinB family protein n=1 Tax=Pedobacter sp. AW31-3R TaxID=3445781 RepID=UPI003FA12BFC